MAAFVAGAVLRAEEPANPKPVLILPPRVVEAERLAPGIVYAAEPVERSVASNLTPVTPGALADALGGVAGLVVQPGFGDIDPPRLSVRGSGLQSAPVNRGLLVRLGELPLNAADGTFNSTLIEPAFFEGVQLRSSSADSAAAALALGGALDFLGSAPTRLAAALGSDGLRTFVAQGALSPFQLPDHRLAYRAAGAFAAMRTDGWRPQSAQERTAVFAQTAWSRQGEFALRASLYGADARYDVPGPLTLAQAETNPDSITGQAGADRPRREAQFGRLAVTGDWRRSGRSLSGSVAVQQSDDWFRQLRSNGIAATRGTDCSLQLSGTWSPALSLGALWLGSWREQQRFTNLAGTTGPRFAQVQQQAQSVTGWADGSWRVAEGLQLTAGISWFYASRAAAGTVAENSDYSAFIPRLGLEWRAGASWKLFARAQRGTEAPTFDDLLAVRGTPAALALGWASLRRQRSDTVEVGVRYQAGSRCEFGITAYAADWRDELLRLADADGVPRGTVNSGPTRHRGVESSLRWEICKGRSDLALRLAHNWSEARFVSDPVYGHNRLAGLPSHVGSAELEWAHDSGPFAALGASWVWGRTFADHANRLAYPGHTLANCRVGWRQRGWSAALEVGNLFDRGFIASTAGVLDRARDPAGTAVFLPGRPRSFTVSVERRW